MDYRVCANCRFRDPFTCFCKLRHCSLTPFGWCPAWKDSIWISILFSDENECEYEYECDTYEKFLEKLMKTS